MHYNVSLNRKSGLLSKIGTPPLRAMSGTNAAGYFAAQLRKPVTDGERNTNVAAANAYVVAAGGVYGC